ncbi:MAG: hypothetical protein IJM88_06565 [Bacteroidales bacterium]|nr:hypothetical protein [Bacteroidales bacterium]
MRAAKKTETSQCTSRSSAGPYSPLRYRKSTGLSSLPHSEQITEAARQLGRGIARGGHTLLYGGSNLGLMGAMSGAALQESGRVVGVIPTFFSDDIIHSQPVSELVRVRTLAAGLTATPRAATPARSSAVVSPCRATSPATTSCRQLTN